VRDLVERLYDEGVATVYVGDLTDVLEAHWSVRVNEKTHNFWAFKKFIHRLACVCEEYGISLETESEAWTSQTCPERGDHEKTVRHEDTLTCPCGFEGTPTSRRQRRSFGKTAIAKSGRWHGPCDSRDDHDWSGKLYPSRKSQRSAHEPASCLRGSVAEPSTEESSRFSAGRMSSTARPYKIVGRGVLQTYVTTVKLV